MRKLVKGCLITILVILILAIALGSYAFLYVPKAEKLATKINSHKNITAKYYENLGSSSLNVVLTIAALNSICEFDFEDVEVVEFSYGDGEEFIDPDGEETAYGVIVYTDSIKTSMKLMIEFIKYVMKEKDSQEIEFHVSARGKAVFIGNTKGELEFRKVLF